MKKLTKTITALLLAGTTLSLMCGCDNGAAKDKNSSVSGGSSATQSTTDKSDTSSKDEIKHNNIENKDNSEPDEASKSSDEEYEEIMKLVNQLSDDSTMEEVYNLFGEPDRYSLLSSSDYVIYYFSKYKVMAESIPKFKISVIDLSKPENPYDENAKYSSEFMEVLNKVSPIKQNFTEEDVKKILGKPDQEQDKSHETFYDYGEYSVIIRYIKNGLLLSISNLEKGEIVNVIYPS